ncbi:MAG TPA: DUF2142 domain-containing protein [Anaerolineales bacterium]|nr:DUF2142 domain-containing protein [Anaerolineales bacterium]
MKDKLQRIFLQDGSWRGAEIYLLLVLLVFGVGTCFLLPISGGYDEETHLVRIWEMSAFSFIPNDDAGGEMPFPAVYWELSYRRQFIVRPVEPGFWQKYGSLSIDAHDYIYGNVETRSVYSPPLLLPQAMVMRLLGRRQQLPALTVYYAIRLTGLIAYAFLALLAVRWIPAGKWVLAVLAASPVAILQASSISADAISNGIALLFLAGSLAIAARKEIRWRELLLLLFLFSLLFFGKINLISLAPLPFLIIPPAKFTMRRGYLILLGSVLLLFLIEVAGWALIAYSRLTTPPEGTDPLGQVRFMLTQPFEFLPILFRDALGKSVSYMVDWIAMYPFNYWPVPAWIHPLYMLALLSALFVGVNDTDRRTRYALVIVFVISYLATITLMYITFNPVRNPFIGAVQGRYFVTALPPLFLALAGLPTLNRARLPIIFPAALGVSSLILYAAGMYLSYHVLCGSQYYQRGLCYQPNYKNWAPDELYSPPVSNQLTLTQEIVPECNGATELRVWLDASEADPKGTTEFILEEVHLERDLTRVAIPNSAMPERSWYSLKFAPDWESNGKFYLLTIRGSEQGEIGPKIAYSLRQEYPLGKLFENDVVQGRDLIFQVGCLAGLDKMSLTGSP